MTYTFKVLMVERSVAVPQLNFILSKIKLSLQNFDVVSSYYHIVNFITGNIYGIGIRYLY